MNRRAVVAVALAGALAGCLRPAEERARRDENIGQAQGPDLQVTVREGLAAVREISPGRVVLWGSAPSWEVELVSSAAGRAPWTIEVQNCLPGAELRALPAGMPVTVAGGGVPTRRSFSVDLPPGSSRFALAAPGPHAGPFRFAVLSDVQEAIDRVSDVFDRVNAEPGVHFLLGAGDLTEQGTEAQLRQFQRELTRLAVPYFTTLGNHELGRSPPPYQEWFGRASFQFEYHGVVFTLLDSASATIDPIVHGWLDEWLRVARHRPHVVAMHIPPLDPTGVRNGAFASRAEAAALLALLAEGRVDLTLYGHVHSFYAFDNAGIPAFISGGGGALPERFDDMGRHFLVVDAEPGTGGGGTTAATAVLETRVVRVD